MTITVRQGEAAHLVLALRASEGKDVEANPVLEGAVAYPLVQEAKTVSTPVEYATSCQTEGDERSRRSS